MRSRCHLNYVHPTLGHVTVTLAVTGNGDGQGNVWQSAKTIFCWSSERQSERWLQELRDRKRSESSEAESKIIAIWADITTSTVLRGSCADSDGNSERIVDYDVIPALGETAQDCEMERR